jgi:hypothetical protein
LSGDKQLPAGSVNHRPIRRDAWVRVGVSILPALLFLAPRDRVCWAEPVRG